MITHQELLDNFDYHSETGILYRKYKNGDVQQIGCASRRGYLRLRFNKVSFSVHSLAWMFINGAMPNGQIDHINGITNDNRIENLRDVSQSENMRNCALSKNSKSGHLGVYWVEYRRRWRSMIFENGKNNHIGYFLNKSDAVASRKEAESRCGYHTNHGRAV